MRIDTPSDAATLERCWRMVNNELYAIALQRRRLRSVEPEDEQFIMRWWTDLGFMILALLRLRRAAALPLKTMYGSATLRAALRHFDASLPGLRLMRNVGEHAHDYAVEQGYAKEIDRRQLEVGQWDETTFRWLQNTDGTPHELNIDEALAAAENLWAVLRELKQEATSVARRSSARSKT